MMVNAKRRSIKKVVLQIVAIIVTIIFIFPVLWMVLTSFKYRVDIFAMPPKWIFSPTLHSYLYTLQRGFWHPFMNSVIMSVSSIILAMVISIFAAYSFSRFKPAGTDTWMFLILSSRMIPPVAAVIPMFLLYRLLHLGNTYIGMIMLYTMFSLPFALWMLKGFIDQIPREFDEAALADGASVTHVVFDIILPQLGPALVAVAVFSIIFVWNEFLFAYILTGKETRTIPVQIAAGIYTEKGVDWEYISALSTLYIIPVLGVVFFLQKYFLRGLTFGTIRR